MGCDIHLFVEVRGADGAWSVQPGPWPCMDCKGTGRGHDGRACYFCHGAGTRPGFDSLYEHRNYLLFSVLADVRNYHEFPVVPIHDGRGLPDDASAEVIAYMGDPDLHSRSWATLGELRAYDWSALPVRWCDSFVDRLALLDALGSPDDVRLVYAFDN